MISPECTMNWSTIVLTNVSQSVFHSLLMTFCLYFSQNFSGKTLDEKESKCMAHCAEKFLKLTQRVGFRFSEYQAQKALEEKLQTK
jgi:hypothetical protein